jgi:hypothetical protein
LESLLPLPTKYPDYRCAASPLQLI